MKFIEDINLNNRKVILRLDLNVTIKNMKIVDDTKIKKSIPTIKYIYNKGCNILIMSHLGKVSSIEDKYEKSLRIVGERLQELLGLDINFVEDTRGERLENSFNTNRITLMENTRFEDFPEKKESKCDEELSKYWSSLGDVFINDAFGTSHRKHASNYGISKYIESGYGFLMFEEIQGLDPIINNIKHPFTVIMGGAKVDDKVALIENLLNECDYLLVGGGIANTFLKASRKKIGSSLYSEEYVEKVAELIEKYKEKIMMPVDVVVEEDGKTSICDIDNTPLNGIIYDVGPETIKTYSDKLSLSETVFVNGTMGLYENPLYANGTESLYRYLSIINCVKVAGGGDAVASINKMGFDDSFDFLSTGGGATLDYIAERKLQCFEE